MRVPESCAILLPPMSDPRPPIALPSDRDHTGRDLGDAELALLAEAVRSGHLNSTGGRFVPELERGFAELHGLPHAVACASGSAAVHTALAALGVGPGDEVVTTAITDMGAIAPIVYEGAAPVFADVEPDSGLVSAATIAPRITGRTRALIVTHLFGAPCDMAPIVELAQRRGLPIVEDCAQAFLARDTAGPVGTLGDIACYSFQQGKHMTTGEGGIVVTRRADLADRARRFVNKGWGYGDASPDHDRLGCNYRLTELQAAVGVAQLAKLASVVERRRVRANELDVCLGGVPGLDVPRTRDGALHSYWRYALRIDNELVPGGPAALARHLGALGVGSAPNYIRKPAFACALFTERERHPLVRQALAGQADPLGDRDTHPGSHAFLDRVLVLPWNEKLTREHVRFIADSLCKALDTVCSSRARSTVESRRP